MTRRPPIIGLVGGIGAGKSTVAALLREQGCVVCDSDALARESLADPAVLARLRERWGQRVLDGQGGIDRRAVAAIVFSDPAERRFLESVTHPWIESRRADLFARASTAAPALVIDAPLLLEAGLDRGCDAVIFVDAPRSVRLARLRGRGWDEAELVRREAAQWSLERKRGAATHVIANDGDHAALRAAVARVLADLGTR